MPEQLGASVFRLVLALSTFVMVYSHEMKTDTNKMVMILYIKSHMVQYFILACVKCTSSKNYFLLFDIKLEYSAVLK